MTTTLLVNIKMRVYSEQSGLSKEVCKDRCRLELYSQPDYSGFQVTGMIEGFSLEWGCGGGGGGVNFRLRDFFLVGNFGEYFFGWLDLRRDFLVFKLI